MKKLFYLFVVMSLSLTACEPPTGPDKPGDNGGTSSEGTEVPVLPKDSTSSKPIIPSEPSHPSDPESPDSPSEPYVSHFIAKPFSVSAIKTITFSSGNLQYHAANKEWRFAPTQMDYVGNENANIADDYNGWIDLFGWGTGNHPTNKSTNYKDFPAFVDWGVNKVGANASNTYRTLTFPEWFYLVNERSNASNLRGTAKVNGVNGLVLLPDAWVCPTGVVFKSGFADDYCADCYGNNQVISIADWAKLDTSGAVFLPAVGSRNGSEVGGVQDLGNYWSATERASYGGYYFCFGPDGLGQCFGYRSNALSVRLVQD